MIHILLLAALSQTPQTWEAAGNSPPYALSVQGITNGTPVPVSGSLSVAGAADTVGSTATFNANSVCANVLTAGQTGAGFFLAAGTLVATLTPYVSTDSTNGVNGNWTATQFVDISGNKTATQAFTNPNAFAAFGLVLEAGVRAAKVCTTAYTSGSATGNLVASTPQPPPPAAGADVTDRAGRVLGQVTDGTNTIGVSAHPLRTDPTGTTTQPVSAASLPLPTGASTAAKQPALGTAGTASADVITVQGIASMTALKTDGSAVTQPVSGTVTANQGGTWNITNVSGTVSLPTGAATEATLAKIPVAQASTTSGQSGALVQGAVTTGAPTYVTAQTSPLSLTTAGALRTDSSATTQPVSGTVAATQSGSWSLAANQSVNEAQINGVAPSMGNGVSGTGVQRVTLASDSTGQVTLAAGANTIGALTANQSVNLNQVAGSAVQTGNGTAAGAQRVSLASDSTGQVKILGQNNTQPIYCISSAFLNMSTATTTQAVAISGSTKIYVCSWSVQGGGTTSVKLVKGTGTNCATGTTDASQTIEATAQAGIVDVGGGGNIVATTAGSDALCVNNSAAVNAHIRISYAQF